MLIAYLLLSTAAGLAIGYLIANRATQRHMQKCAELQSQLSSSEARLQAAQQQVEAQKEQHAQTLKAQHDAFGQSILRERETAEKMLQEAKSSYRESLEAMKAKFAQMAGEALKERANELKQTNEESIAHLVTPVRGPD